MRKEGNEDSPLLKTDSLFAELVAHYGGGEQREMRAAAKLLLVALDKFRRYGGPDWGSLLDEYVSLVKQNPDKFQRILESQRTKSEQPFKA